MPRAQRTQPNIGTRDLFLAASNMFRKRKFCEFSNIGFAREVEIGGWDCRGLFPSKLRGKVQLVSAGPAEHNELTACMAGFLQVQSDFLIQDLSTSASRCAHGHLSRPM